jgi:hypothetical protein
MKREATFLLKKATDSLILAIEHFNRPIDRGRVSAVLILLDHVNIDPGSESSKKDI